jgi:predicted metalloprotease
MKWTRGYRSDQVDDRRNEVSAAGLSGGALQLLFFLFRRFGILGLLAGGALLFFLTRGSPSMLSGSRDGSGADQAEAPVVEFVSFVFDDVQGAWQRLFAARGARYPLARLELFRGQISSACGLGQTAMGPFYCPNDQRVYIDLAFYDELKQRFGAPGDFAQAYVIGHEVGHHVQHILGTDRRLEQASEGEREGASGLSVRLELQADCYAGVWAHSTEQRQLLEAGDIDEALKAASVIGDDALQRQAGSAVRPESFTHGTSQQRVRWFRRGYDSGEIAACDTFAVSAL